MEIELKDLTKEFVKLFGDLENFNLEKISDENCEKYLNLINHDLDTDYLQKIWQFFMADREGKKQDFSPKSLGVLIAELTKSENEVWVYDMCCGSGALTIQKWISNKKLKFVCEELDEAVIPFLLFNLKIRNIEGYVLNGNILTGEKKAIYKLTPGVNFSKVEPQLLFDYPEFDTVISNPPFNLSGEYETPAGVKFQGSNYKFIFSALEKVKTANMCFILPNGVLTGTGDVEARKYLIENNLFRAVITNPERMFESTSIPTCILYFTNSNEISFVDCKAKNFVEETREQKGELHTQNRVYTKTFNSYSQENIKYILDVIKNKNTVQGFSITTMPEGENLTPGIYVGVEEEKKYTRSYYDIARDLERIMNQKNMTKLTINETWARETHMLELLEKMKKSNDIIERMNDVFKKVLDLDVKLPKSTYLTVTKSKELKLEQKDKEDITTNFLFALEQWKTIIHFLNLEENRLLKEMKEKLLPDLLTGKIDLEGIDI